MLGYLTNQYPKISHTFIRREIWALEAQGVSVARFSIRGPGESLRDATDQRELARTEILLAYGAFDFFDHMRRAAADNPRGFVRAARLAARMGWRSQRGVARHGAYLAEACLLKDLCAARGITHLHVHHATNPAAVALLCKILGGPTYSITVHGPEEFEYAARLALNQKIAGAAFVIAVSEWGRAQLFLHSDTAEHHKIHLIRNGAPPEFANAMPAPLPDTPRVLWVGRIEEQKDPLLLVAAVARLRAQKVSCAVTMIGDGSLRAAVENEIARGALRAAIALRGWATPAEILNELRASRALVLSSRAENVPSAILEALLQERTVISTDVGGVRELVQDHETGWLAPPRDADALARAMRCALEMPRETLQAMGARGRQYILSRYDAHAQARALRALLASVSASRQGN
jgi:colanic acid/amylovoran biosynthesis glycosyltransferase